MNIVSRHNKGRIEEDRVNGLSDALLIHILSFLPAKDAVATCLLSKRWRQLWRSVNTLDLRIAYSDQPESFVKFVDKLFESVDLQSVKKCVLDFGSETPPQETSKWLAMISSRVEQLEIHMCWSSQYELSSCVFLSNSIRVLKLSHGRVNTLSHVNLSSLEVLHLVDVKFQDFRSLELLLNACSIVKDLFLRYRDVKDFRPLRIERLNHLVTAYLSPQSLIPFEAISNIKSLCIKQHTRQDIWPFSHDIPIFHNLTHLRYDAVEWTKMVKCLESFPKLQQLVIGEIYFASHPGPVVEVPSCVSCQLKELILLHSEGTESESEFLKFMMKNVRALRAIYVCAESSHIKLPKFKKLAASFRSGRESESCSQVHEGPLLFMVS